jgi:hypothetical protein
MRGGPESVGCASAGGKDRGGNTAKRQVTATPERRRSSDRTHAGAPLAAIAPAARAALQLAPPLDPPPVQLDVRCACVDAG